MGERVLKDGSIDYSQGVIGPSLSDRNLAKRSEGSSPGNFSARNNFHVSDLAPVAIIAPLALAGCEISIGGENREIKTESLSQHFDSFLQENGGKPNRQLMTLWTQSLGIPYEATWQLDERPLDVLDSPDIETLNYFQIILKGNGLPTKGDIVITEGTDNYRNGRSGIATADVGRGNDGKLYEEALATDQSSGYPLLFQFPLDGIAGWLKPTEFIRPEMPDEVAEVSDNMSVSELFDAFYYKYDRLYVEAEDDSPEGKFSPSDLIMAWVDTLGIPRETVRYETSDQVLRERKAITDKYFEFIEYREGSGLLPKKGDIMIINSDDDSDDRMAIATGEGKVEEYAGVFTQGDSPGNPSFGVYYSFGYFSGWLTPRNLPGSETSDAQAAEKNVINGESQEGQVLGANTESISEVYKAFLEKYNGQGVETSDSSNFRQCVDLIWAWLDEMKIPRDSIRNFDPDHPYASQIYTNANDETRKYFEVISYEDDMKLQLGDLAVWGPEVGSVAGHVGIATGEENIYFSQNYPLEENPEYRKAHLQKISTQGLMGILRPKGFSEGTEPQPPGEFVPKNETEFARYQFAEVFLEYLDQSGGGWHSWWENSTNLSVDERERIRQALARGEKIDSTFIYETRYITHVFAHSRPEPELYLYDDDGDIYEQRMQLIQGELKNWGLKLVPDDEQTKVRNAYRVVWSGDVYLTGEIQAGTADIVTRGTLEELQGWIDQDHEFDGFKKITELSLVDPIEGNTRNHIYVYENGDIEISGNYNEFADPLDGDLTFLFYNFPGINNYSANGYNGEFEIESESLRP